jgi:hypothetical protein
MLYALERQPRLWVYWDHELARVVVLVTVNALWTVGFVTLLHCTALHCSALPCPSPKLCGPWKGLSGNRVWQPS